MKKYEKLWQNLYTNNLFYTLDTKLVWNIKWTAVALYNIDQSIKDSTLWECTPLYWLNKNCFIIVEEGNNIKIIYDVYWELREIFYKWKNYFLITEGFWDWCAGSKTYKLYTIEGNLLNKIYNGESWCESSNYSFKKWDLTIEVIYYSEKVNSSVSGNFQEIAVYYSNKLVEKKVLSLSKFDFNLNSNLFNWNLIEIKIWDKLVSFKEDDYRNIKEFKSQYWMYWVLEKTEKWYSLIGKLWDSFEYNSIANEISVLNCKNNDSGVLDDSYTLNKFKPWETEFIYNIAKEYWNYCIDWIYTVTIKVQNKKSWEITQWVSDYKLDLK
jgi:hypothetical protein